MKVTLERRRKIYRSQYAKGDTVDVPDAFGRRLIYIGDATKGKGKVSDSKGTRLPKGLPKIELIKTHGYKSKEEVLKADLTEIKGIGKSTEKHIKDALR